MQLSNSVIDDGMKNSVNDKQYAKENSSILVRDDGIVTSLKAWFSILFTDEVENMNS